MKLVHIAIFAVLSFSISCKRTKTDPAYEYQIVTLVNDQQLTHSLGSGLETPEQDYSQKLSDFIFRQLKDSEEPKILVHMNLYENGSGKIQVGQTISKKLNRWSFSLEKHGDAFRLSSIESQNVVTLSEESAMSVWIAKNIERFLACEKL